MTSSTKLDLRKPGAELDASRLQFAGCGAGLNPDENRSKSFLEKAPLPIASVTNEGVISFRNERFIQVFGYTAEEVPTLAEWWLRAYPDPGYRRWATETWYGAVQRAEAEERDVEPIEYRVTCKNGEVRVFEITGTKLGDELLTTFIDRTSRTLVEESLRRNELLLTEAQRIAGLGSYVLDIATGVWSSSVVMDELFGIGPAYDRSVEGWAALIHPDDRGVMMDYFVREVIGQKHLFNKEYRIVRHSDQSVRWLHGLGQLKLDDHGIPVEMIGTIQDITERKLAEGWESLTRHVLEHLNSHRSTPNMIRDVLRLIKQGIGFDAVGIRLRKDDDYPYLVQRGFSNDFLLTENSLVVRSQDGRVCRNKDGSLCLECTCGLVISGKGDISSPFFTKGGSFWTNNSMPLLDLPADVDPRLHPRNRCIYAGFMSVGLIPLRGGDAIIGLLQLNDRRPGRFTPELLRFLERLAASIGIALKRALVEEEKDRLHAQLRQSQKMESVGRLAGGIAHDFNNLLMGIMGYADICRDSLPAEHPIRSHLDEIISSAERSANLTRQLLAFARKQSISPRVLDLNDAVGGMLKLLRRMIGEAIDLAWIPGSNLWSVKIDPSQVDQIMANLCVNARDAINGTGKVVVESANAILDDDYCEDHPGAFPGEYVRLDVRDDGCGMDKGVLDHIFEPFFTTKKTGEGTGLGLATVYGIVKQNNGYISVVSEMDRGTTISIYLPRVMKEVPAELGKTIAETPPSRGETVLLVEDEFALREMCFRFLEKLGYKVLVAEDPAAALDMASLHRGRLDLLLTDVVMPGMDGRQLAQRLATIRPGVKVLYMSGYTRNVIERHGVLEPGVAFIEKPFTRDQMGRKIREVLD